MKHWIQNHVSFSPAEDEEDDGWRWRSWSVERALQKKLSQPIFFSEKWQGCTVPLLICKLLQKWSFQIWRNHSTCYTHQLIVYSIMSNPHTWFVGLRLGWLPSSGKQELSSPSPGTEGSRTDGRYTGCFRITVKSKTRRIRPLFRLKWFSQSFLGSILRDILIY